MKICLGFPEKIALDAEAVAVCLEQTKLVRPVGVPDRDEWDVALEAARSAMPKSIASVDLAEISGKVRQSSPVTASLGPVPG